ncbi:MAG: BamA/TamA family outer membrane protein [Phycisphaeraceae bacterium]|nr:BamA/TamA family outer membrane protein [Phycisphaeraceae bacterium]
MRAARIFGLSILPIVSGLPIAPFALRAEAQSVAAEPGAYDGRPIREIRVTRPAIKDGQRVDEALDADLERLVRANIRLQRGRPYRQQTAAEDISRLNRLGRFRRIETRAQLMEDGSVIVSYDVIPQPIVKDVQAVGNTKFPDSKIAEQVEAVVGTPVDSLVLDRAARRIEDMYRKKGYYLVQATWDEQSLEEQGIVLFRIREGERVRAAEIRYEGNLSFTPSELGSAVKTRPSFPIFRTGAIDDDQLDADTRALVEFYRDRGYLDVEVAPSIRIAPNGREAIVTFVISEGRLYTLRNVRVLYVERSREFDSEQEAIADLGPLERVVQDPFRPRGWLVTSDGLMPPDQIVAHMSVKPGDAYSVRKINDSVESIRSAYGQMGYTEARIRRYDPRSTDSPEVDLLLTIAEGSRFKTGIIEIQGNDLTKGNVVLRNMEIKPDRPLNTVAIDESQRLITNTRVFDGLSNPVKVTPQRPDRADPAYRDVLVEVTETNTGALGFGVVTSSDSGVAGSISLTQRNFDLFDTPDTASEFFSGRAFRGAGQTFRIEALPGTEVQTYSISLSDPALFDSDYSASISAYYRDRDFSDYDEERYGTRIGFGRRFGTRWTGNLSMRLESVELSDIDEDQPTEVFEFADQAAITGLGFNLTRSTYDNIFRPSKGTRVVLSAEQVGILGGDYDFTKLGADYTTFFKVREDALGRKTILSLNLAANYIPQNRGDVPVYERYYLGGRSFRGFDFRTVSPKGIRNDNGEPSDDPVGGLWSFFAGAEIKQPVFGDMISVVGFVDSGTVLIDPGFDDYRVAVGLGVRLYIPQLSPFDLAFDFGFPIIKQDGDEERLFSFSIDLPF